MIRVLFVTHCDSMGGANRSMLQLIIELREKYQVKPFVIIPLQDKNKYSISLSKYLDIANIEYEYQWFPWFRQTVICWRSYVRYIKYFFVRKKTVKKLKAYNFDIVHTNSCTIEHGAYIAKKLNVKHIWHLREFGKSDFKFRSIFGRIYDRYLYTHKADCLIAISRAVKKEYLDRCPSNKIDIIYNGIEKIDESFASEHKNTTIQFICAGDIKEAKNQKEIVEAVKILSHRYSCETFHVTIVGNGQNKYCTELKNELRIYDLEKYITILSEMPNLNELRSKMDVGIVPSRSEAFGRVTIEYMLQNLAVIANNRGANPEIIDNNSTGLIYKYLHPEELANCMELYICHKNVMIRHAFCGKNKAEKLFLSSYNTSRIYEKYNMLTGKK